MKRDILAAVADGAMTTHPSRPAGRGSKRRRDTLEFGVKLLFLLCGCVAVGCVLFICIYLIVAGLPAVLEIGITDFLFGTEWAGKQGQFGILPFILTSVAGTAGAVLVGVPVGILTAMFLAKVAPPKAARVIRTAVELLAGIPSIVYGLVGMIVLVPAIQRTFQLASGATLLAAIVVLAVMILPSIINVSETALRAVPIFRISLPAARSGVATAVVLGVGRAIGEAMAIIMVSGNVPNMPESLFAPVRFLTTAIASEMSYAAVGSLWQQALYSVGLVLFLFIMIINVILNVCIKNRKEG